MTAYKESPSQTAGPYVHIGCTPSVAGLSGMYGGRDPGSTMVQPALAASKIALTCLVYDGDGEPLKDAMLEIWQPGPNGSFDKTEGFENWGRAATDAKTGLATFETVKPGGLPDAAPHVLVWIVARGINLGLTTRIYFADESAQNAKDPVYCLAKERAQTLLAQPVEGGYHHDIYLQGDLETVFFDV